MVRLLFVLFSHFHSNKYATALCTLCPAFCTLPPSAYRSPATILLNLLKIRNASLYSLQTQPHINHTPHTNETLFVHECACHVCNTPVRILRCITAWHFKISSSFYALSVSLGMENLKWKMCQCKDATRSSCSGWRCCHESEAVCIWVSLLISPFAEALLVVGCTNIIENFCHRLFYLLTWSFFHHHYHRQVHLIAWFCLFSLFISL